MANFMDTLLLRIDVQSRNAEAALKRVSIMVEGLAASTRGLGTMFMQLNQSQLAGITKTNAMMVKQSGYTDLLAQANQNAV